jgi:hypothetical protein
MTEDVNGEENVNNPEKQKSHEEPPSSSTDSTPDKNKEDTSEAEEPQDTPVIITPSRRIRNPPFTYQLTGQAQEQPQKYIRKNDRTNLGYPPYLPHRPLRIRQLVPPRRPHRSSPLNNRPCNPDQRTSLPNRLPSPKRRPVPLDIRMATGKLTCYLVDVDV